MNVLVVEDDIELNNMLRKRLGLEKIHVNQAYDGLEALAYLEQYTFDVIVMDIMMPKMDGYKCLEELRKREINTPVLFLSAKDSDLDVIKGLNIGADDYLVKPFNFQVLLARLNALSRRNNTIHAGVTHYLKDIEIDEAKYVVRRAGNEIILSHKEFELLLLFARNQNIVLSREKIEESLYGIDSFNDSNVIDVHIRNLRKKIEIEGLEPIIETVRGVGYIVRVKQDK